MPKRKTFNRPALSCTSTRTHLEGRRSVELANLLSCPRGSRAGVSVAVRRLPIGTDIVPHVYFCIQICDRLVGMMKIGDAGIFFLFTTALNNPNSAPKYPNFQNVGNRKKAFFQISSKSSEATGGPEIWSRYFSELLASAKSV